MSLKRALLLFALTGAVLGAPALFAADNGEPPVPLDAPAGVGSGYSLTYDNFSGTCDAASFSTSATGHVDLATDVTVDGRTTLDGAAYDTFGFGLAAGTYSFATGFGRTFAPALPDATYTFVFYSRLLANGDQGTSVTTISCANGVFSGSNVFVPFTTQAIPALGKVGLGLLALLLVGGALFALRRTS